MSSYIAMEEGVIVTLSEEEDVEDGAMRFDDDDDKIKIVTMDAWDNGRDETSWWRILL